MEIIPTFNLKKSIKIQILSNEYLPLVLFVNKYSTNENCSFYLYISQLAH